MPKVKLFYSYSHKDEAHRDELEKRLATLRANELIDEWHDRKIDAGDDWDDEIEINITNAHIILLLFSSDFIASKACQKEVALAMKLKKEKNTVFIPIILRECSWKDVAGMPNILGLPKDGLPIQKWEYADDAWSSVYEGIKNKVEKIRNAAKPTIKDEFKKDLLHNPIEDCTLDKLFVYPDILEINTEIKQKLENNEIDSEKLKHLDKNSYKYILI
ncbi:MAG: toll/interleukin-1 receptor domain-containing protein [Gammaproteobacteria bacterium]|nr:toll/interleukin-1 receptor domain-containing protein [Gammaproteobacteria bacterium]